MVGSEFFSKGFNGVVRTILKPKNFLEQTANLEKLSFEKKPYEALITYYYFQIAKLIFPNNFIHITATIPNFTLYTPLSHVRRLEHVQPEYFSSIYSRRADVNSDHALFSAHAERRDGKKFICNCKACSRHKHFHENIMFRAKRTKIVNEAEKWGFLLPDHDPSDYCLDNKGRIVFFEIDNIVLGHLENTLEKKGHKKAAQIRRFMSRINEIKNSYNQL